MAACAELPLNCGRGAVLGSQR